MNTSDKHQKIDRASLKAKLDNRELFHLWNVQEKEHYEAASNIEGSQWVSCDFINADRAAERVAGKSETIVLYCGGDDSAPTKKAAGKLASYGYTDVFTYEGGIKDWSAAGLPLVKA